MERLIDNSNSSVTQDSDELEEMHCESCLSHFQRKTIADGFCVDCSEYMCQTCLDYHMIYMSQHVIKDKYNMPKDFCFVQCPFHEDLLLKFYCSTCKAFACSKCKIESHTNCANLIHFPSTVDGIEKEDEVQSIDENLAKFIKELNDTKQAIVSNIKYVKKQEKLAKSTIMKNREEGLKTKMSQLEQEIERFDEYMTEALAKLEKERKEFNECIKRKRDIFEKKTKEVATAVTKKVENFKTVDLSNLKSIEKRVEKLLTDVREQKSCLSIYCKTGQRCKLFISVKTSDRNFNELKNSISDIKNNIECHVYDIKPVGDLLQEEISDTETNIFQLQERNLSWVPKCAKTDFELYLKNIRGTSICFISETALIATNFDDSALVAFNLTKKQTAEIHLPSRPWAIAYIEYNRIAVTFPNANFIGLITFDDYQNVKSKVKIANGLSCYGIAYFNNKLIVSHSRNVMILDMSGNVLKDVVGSKGDPLFKDPHYLAVNRDTEIIYVSDAVNNTVTSITFEGKVVSIYRDSQLSRPYDLVVDKSGAVFVCGQATNNVHQLSSDLTKVNILLSENDGVKIPAGISLCQSGKKLCVLLFNGTIKVYDIMI